MEAFVAERLKAFQEKEQAQLTARLALNSPSPVKKGVRGSDGGSAAEEVRSLGVANVWC